MGTPRDIPYIRSVTATPDVEITPQAGQPRSLEQDEPDTRTMVPMRHALIVALLLTLAGCGGGSPTSPSPQPQPPGPTRISGTITDTMTGAQVGTFSSEASSFPARVSVSASGYVTRETWVRSASPTVDLIPEAGFDVTFYRQMARGTLEGSMQPLRVISQAPSIYLQTTGLSAANVAALEAAARAVVPALTGGKFQVQAWETGDAVRQPSSGWIIVDLVNEPDGASCGRSEVGSAAGHSFLNTAARCGFNGFIIDPGTLAHELGHALGFWHAEAAPLMRAGRIRGTAEPSDLERRHAAIAYHRSAGNLDVDTDPVAPAALRPLIVE